MYTPFLAVDEPSVDLLLWFSSHMSVYVIKEKVAC